MDILCKFPKQIGPNKRLGWRKTLKDELDGKFANGVGWKKCKQGGEKSKNDNREDSFIWHLRVGSSSTIY